jgi:uncharacterized membrane protein YccC
VLGGLLAIALVLAGLLVMFGATTWAKQIVVGVVLCAVFMPALCGVLAPLLAPNTIVTGVVVGAAVVALSVGIAGFRRYLSHRRALHRWWGATPQSLKQRVERDL